jgi:hypothetical protein
MSATKLTLLATLAGRQSNLGVTDTRLRGGDRKEGSRDPADTASGANLAVGD